MAGTTSVHLLLTNRTHNVIKGSDARKVFRYTQDGGKSDELGDVNVELECNEEQVSRPNFL